MKYAHHCERSRFTSIENHLLNTFFSGLYISSADLIKIARSVGISMQMNSRELQIKELLNKSYDNGNLAAVINLLNELIDERVYEYHKLGLDYPASMELLTDLAQKANKVKSLFSKENRKDPYE